MLLEKSAKSHVWTLLKANILYLYSRLFLVVVQLQYDENGILAGFIVSNFNLRGEMT